MTTEREQLARFLFEWALTPDAKTMSRCEAAADELLRLPLPTTERIEALLASGRRIFHRDELIAALSATDTDGFCTCGGPSGDPREAKTCGLRRHRLSATDTGEQDEGWFPDEPSLRGHP